MPPTIPPTPTIIGVGLVTPLGDGAWPTIRALLAGRRTADRLAEMPEGVDLVTLARATAGSALSGFTLTDPAIELAERAAREALTDSALPPEQGRGIRTIVASSKGAVAGLVESATCLAGARDAAGRLIRAVGSIEERALCAALGPHAYLCHHLRRRLDLGDTSAVVAACATSLAALHLAWREITEGRAERVLVVAVESALTPLFVHSYARLGVLAPLSPPAAHVARPLDEGRCGFTLCESAAAVVLSVAPVEQSAGRRAMRLLSVALGTQPHDIVRAAPSYDVLSRIVREVAAAAERAPGIPGAAVALIQPHATGTPDNDERELQALAAAIGPRAREAAVYASKGAIGHPLGAAGLVNVVLSCLMARIGRRPPMPWLESPIVSPFKLLRDEQPVREGLHVITSAGFGGHVGACALG